MSSTRNKRLVIVIVAVITAGIGAALALVGRSVHEATWRVPVTRVEVSATAAGQPLERLDDGRLKVPSATELRLALPTDAARYPFVNVAIGSAVTVVSFGGAGERAGLNLSATPSGWQVLIADPLTSLSTATTITLIASNRALSNGLVAEILDGESPTDLSDRGAVWGEVNLAWVVPEGSATPAAPAPPGAAAP